MTRTLTTQKIFDAAAANGAGKPVLVAGFPYVMLQICGALSPDLTIKITGSLSNPKGPPPDFTAAADVTNPWDYVASFDYNDPMTPIIGSTGFAFTGILADFARNVLVNVDGLTWLNAEISGYSAGEITITMISFANE